jgi:hypothetical protein
MKDDEFLDAFHNGTLPPAEFRHTGHLRLAWLVLKSHNFEEAAGIISRDILGVATSQGSPSRFHETLTRFWVHMVKHAMENGPNLRNIDELIERFPLLLKKDLPYRHWSRDVFESGAARAGWIEPDLLRLP